MVSNTPGNIENFFWKFAKSPGNFLAEFVCLLLLWLAILVSQNVSVETSGFVFSCNCNCYWWLDDTVLGVGWGLSPHAFSFKLKFTVQKPRILLNFCQNVS